MQRARRWTWGLLSSATVLLTLVVLATPVSAIVPTSADPTSPGTLALGSTGWPPLSWVSLVTTATSHPSAGAAVGTHLLNFYGVDMGDAGLGPNSLASLGVFFNSTPLTVYRFGDGGGSYDPTTNTYYAPGPTGAYVPSSSGTVPNFSWFQSWCNSRTPHCEWMVDLPAEENNSGAALHFAKWYHQVLGFAPTFWEFGNEPIAWTHYGINMSKWNSHDNSAPTGVAYATMVHNYIAAVSNAFPKDKFLGIQSYCACDKVFVPPTAQVDGAKVSGMAYHEYPALTNSTTSLSQFYGALVSPANVSNAASHFQTLMTSSCSTCSHIPVDVGEYQAGPAGGIANYSLQYPGAPFIAASVIQALEANISTFSLFELSWLYQANNGTLAPEGILYQRILNNLTMGTDYPVNLNAPTVGGTWGILVKNGSREALLLVNTNTTYTLRLGIATGLFPVGGSGTVYQWSPSLTFPGWHRWSLLPKSFTLGPQGLLMLTNY